MDRATTEIQATAEPVRFVYGPPIEPPKSAKTTTARPDSAVSTTTDRPLTKARLRPKALLVVVGAVAIVATATVATVLLTRHDNPTKVASSSTKSITLTGHTDTVQSAAFNPDGTEIAIASGDSTVIIWDVATGKQLDTLTGHADLVRSLDARSRVAAGRPRSCGGERREYGDDPKPPTGSVVGDQGGDLR